MVSITIDTNIYPTTAESRNQLAKLASKHSLDIAIVTVSEREMAGTDIALNFQSISEATVWGESPWRIGRWSGCNTLSESVVMGDTPMGLARMGTAKGVDLEELLSVISNNSFPPPGQRTNLSHGQRKQLRDAMILEAHIFHKRDIFVSNDIKAYIGKLNGKRRAEFEKRYAIRIMTLTEFESWLCLGSFKKRGYIFLLTATTYIKRQCFNFISKCCRNINSK